MLKLGTILLTVFTWGFCIWFFPSIFVGSAARFKVFSWFVFVCIFAMNYLLYRSQFITTSLKTLIRINCGLIILLSVPLLISSFTLGKDLKRELYARCGSSCSTSLLNDLEGFFQKDQKKYSYHLIYDAPVSYFDSLVGTKIGNFEISKNGDGSFTDFTDTEFEYITVGRIGALKRKGDIEDYFFPVEEGIMFISFSHPPLEAAGFRSFFKK